MPSRRALLAGIASGSSLIAGCFGSDPEVARCSSRGVGSSSRHLRRVAPITGDEQVALGVLVSPQATAQDTYHAVEIRNSDERLVASIPLQSNRDMSRLDADEWPIFGADEGELYAVPLGPPPVHGEYTAVLVNASEEEIATATIRFNCYSYDGSLP